MSVLIFGTLLLHVNGLSIRRPEPRLLRQCPMDCIGYFDGCNQCGCSENGIPNECTIKECANYLPMKCTQCKEGYALMNGQCQVNAPKTLDQCSEGFYYDNGLGRCNDKCALMFCLGRCKAGKCIGILDTNGRVDHIPEDTIINNNKNNNNNNDDGDCQNGFYYDTELGRCNDECAFMRCLGDCRAGECLGIPTTEVIHNNNGCKPGHYYETRTGTCEDSCALMDCLGDCIDGACIAIDPPNICTDNCKTYNTRCTSKNCTTGNTIFYPCAPVPNNVIFVKPEPYCICNDGYEWNANTKTCDIIPNNNNIDSLCNTCASYSDGCNSCSCNGDNGFAICTLRACSVVAVPFCLTCKDTIECDTDKTCEAGCIIWNDGCNECYCDEDSKQVHCTSRQCITQGEPFCKKCKDGQDCSANLERIKNINQLKENIKIWHEFKKHNGIRYTFIQRNIRYHLECFTQNMIIHVDGNQIKYVKFENEHALAMYCENNIDLFNSAVSIDQYKTINDILTGLEKDIKNFDEIKITYHERGYPNVITADPITMAIDDKFTTEITCLSFANDEVQCDIVHNPSTPIICNIEGQTYKECMFQCNQPVCGSISMCDPYEQCKPGCQCPATAHYVDPIKNKCVITCPRHTETEIPSILQPTIDDPEPPIHGTIELDCPVNMVYSTCKQISCVPTCDTPFVSNCKPEPCIPGCVCKEGFIEHNGECINVNNCPNKCIDGCETYFDGCNECQCVNGFVKQCSNNFCTTKHEPYCIKCNQYIDNDSNNCVEKENLLKQNQLSELKKYYSILKQAVSNNDNEYQFTQQKTYYINECYLQRMLITVKSNKVVNVTWNDVNFVPKYCLNDETILSDVFNLNNYKTMIGIAKDLMNEIIHYDYIDITYNILRGFPTKITIDQSRHAIDDVITVNYDCLSFRNDVLQCNGDITNTCESNRIYDYCNFGCNGQLTCNDVSLTSNLFNKCVENPSCKSECVCPPSKPYWNNKIRKCLNHMECQNECVCDIKAGIYISNRWRYFQFKRKCKNIKNSKQCLDKHFCNWNCNTSPYVSLF